VRFVTREAGGDTEMNSTLRANLDEAIARQDHLDDLLCNMEAGHQQKLAIGLRRYEVVSHDYFLANESYSIATEAVIGAQHALMAAPIYDVDDMTAKAETLAEWAEFMPADDLLPFIIRYGEQMAAWGARTATT
jgi:hypothetical protein